MNKILISIAVVIFILIMIYAWTRDPNIDGFWSGDMEFCETSGIDNMLLYFGDTSLSFTGTSRECYMYIGPDVAMQQFTIHHGIFSTSAEYEDDSELWPEKLKIKRKGDTIYVFDDTCSELYAKLHKRADLNHATEMTEDSDDE